MVINRRQRISSIIKQLEKAKNEHGDLFVYYASDYDWCIQVYFATVEDYTGMDGAAKGKALYFN